MWLQTNRANDAKNSGRFPGVVWCLSMAGWGVEEGIIWWLHSLVRRYNYRPKDHTNSSSLLLVSHDVQQLRTIIWAFCNVCPHSSIFVSFSYNMCGMQMYCGCIYLHFIIPKALYNKQRVIKFITLTLCLKKYLKIR